MRWKIITSVLVLILIFFAFFLPQPKSALAPPQKPPRWSLLALGDIMLSENRNSGRAMAKHGAHYPFAHLATLTRKATLTFANLECPIASSGWSLPGKQITFRAKPQAIEALEHAGIDLVSLANNHILDYNEAALLETIAYLQKHNIGTVGAGKNWHEAISPLYLTVRGQKVAFFAATEMADLFFSYSYPRSFRATETKPGVAALQSQWLLPAIAQARQKADLVVISLHWGIEDSSYVTPKQRALARELIDAGADLILGHHPHVLQGLEFYKGRPIVYSLANCIFDQNDELNKEGMLLTLHYEGSKLQRVWALPTYMYEKGQGRPAIEEKGERIRERLIKLSEALGTNCVQMGEAVYFSAGEGN